MTLRPGRCSANSPSKSTDVAAIHAPVLPDEHSRKQSQEQEQWALHPGSRSIHSPSRSTDVAEHERVRSVLHVLPMSKCSNCLDLLSTNYLLYTVVGYLRSLWLLINASSIHSRKNTLSASPGLSLLHCLSSFSMLCQNTR